MPITELSIAFFVITGLVFIFQGISFIRKQESFILIGNQLTKERKSYLGLAAIIHGVLYILLGVLALIWGIIPVLFQTTKIWTVIISGTCSVIGFMFVIFIIISLIPQAKE